MDVNSLPTQTQDTRVKDPSRTHLEPTEKSQVLRSKEIKAREGRALGDQGQTENLTSQLRPACR